MTIQKGDKVRMTQEFKIRMRGECLPEKHLAPTFLPEEEMPDDGCTKCSADHIEEFGDLEGIVLDHLEFRRCSVGRNRCALVKRA